MKIPHSTFYYRGKEKLFKQLKAEADLMEDVKVKMSERLFTRR